MIDELKTMKLPSSGSRATMIGRLVEARLGGPTAPPIEIYMKAQPGYKRGRNATPEPRGRH